MGILKWFTYIMNMSKFRYFSYSEFDSPDLKGSGKKMSDEFILMLDEARIFAGIPFFISSGFRTKEYNQDLIKRGFKASKNSSHLKGLAVDIKCVKSDNRWLIIDALLYAGINRIGISKTFIHCDIDSSKQDNIIFLY